MEICEHGLYGTLCHKCFPERHMYLAIVYDAPADKDVDVEKAKVLWQQYFTAPNHDNVRTVRERIVRRYPHASVVVYHRIPPRAVH